MKFIVLALLAISSTVSAQVAPATDQIKLVPAIKKIAIVDNKHYAVKKDENNKYVFIKVAPEGRIVKPQIITIIPAK
mgnify:CR=1 FL=1|tara:strand:- start:2581 stop:2811 length:231 start_codon:yes stop_codon:yes gene_type:complete